MKANKSIWLSEYEGLVICPAAEPVPMSASEPANRPRREYEAVSPHFAQTPTDLEKNTPLAFFE